MFSVCIPLANEIQSFAPVLLRAPLTDAAWSYCDCMVRPLSLGCWTRWTVCKRARATIRGRTSRKVGGVFRILVKVEYLYRSSLWKKDMQGSRETISFAQGKILAEKTCYTGLLMVVGFAKLQRHEGSSSQGNFHEEYSI